MTVTDTIKRIVADQLGTSERKVAKSMLLVEDLGCDILDMVELQMSVEDVYDIEIPDEDFDKCHTVGEFIEYIGKRVGV